MLSPNNSSTEERSPRSVIKKEDGFLAYYFSAQIANRIVSFSFKYLPLTPDFYTTNSLVLGFAAAGLFAYGTYQAVIVGLILLHISFIFDCCDGQLARLQGLKIERGAWFDYHSDKLKDGALLLGFATGAHYQQHVGVWIFAVAFAGIFFQFLRNIAALNRDIFYLQRTGKKDSPRVLIKDTGHSQLLRTLKHSSLFKLSDRVLLYTIFGILGQAWLGVVVYALLAGIFSTASAALNYKTFSKFDKTQTL